MRVIYLLISIALITTQVSCGPSEAEKQKTEEAKVAHDDSVKKAAEDEIQRKYAAKEKITNSIRDTKDQLEGSKNRLIALRSNLEVQRDQMNKIKEWQLGRSQGEREQQIGQQSIVIQNTQNEITATQENVDRLQQQLNELNTQLQGFNN